MGPKKAAGATTTKKAAAPATHPPYLDMIKEAIIRLKDRGGSSRQSIKKYVQSFNNLSGVSEAAFTTNINRALQKGSENGTFVRPKGPSGPVKLGAPTKSADKSAAKKTATKAKTTKAKTTTKKAAAPKTAATKKASTTKTAAKPKSTANTSKVRKTPAMAPAVEDKKPVALTKTKSGRVQKSTAPQPEKKTAKKAATTKKAAPKKAAAPKKE